MHACVWLLVKGLFENLTRALGTSQGLFLGCDNLSLEQLGCCMQQVVVQSFQWSQKDKVERSVSPNQQQTVSHYLDYTIPSRPAPLSTTQNLNKQAKLIY